MTWPLQLCSAQKQLLESQAKMGRSRKPLCLPKGGIPNALHKRGDVLDDTFRELTQSKTKSMKSILDRLQAAVATLPKLGFDSTARFMRMSKHVSGARERWSQLGWTERLGRSLVFVLSHIPTGTESNLIFSKIRSEVRRCRGRIRDPQRFLRWTLRVLDTQMPSSETCYTSSNYQSR